MKDLKSLVQHPSVQGGTALHLISGNPIILVRGTEKKKMGQPLTSQQLLGLLKTSLPPEVVGGFQWGKELAYLLRVDEHEHEMRIGLKSDRSFHIEIKLATTEKGTVPEAPTRAAPPPARPRSGVTDDEIPDSLLEELTSGESPALIFHTGHHLLEEMDQCAGDMGFEPRKTDHAGAAGDVLNYHDYPLLFLQMDEHFREHPLYANLISMKMDRRRRQFSVLIAPGLKTGDSLSAFSSSVNLVVSPEDVGMLYEHVHKAFNTWKRYTGTFHELLEAAGKL